MQALPVHSSTSFSTSSPLVTRPKATFLPSSWGHGPRHSKNCEPLPHAPSDDQAEHPPKACCLCTPFSCGPKATTPKRRTLRGSRFQGKNHAKRKRRTVPTRAGCCPARCSPWTRRLAGRTGRLHFTSASFLLPETHPKKRSRKAETPPRPRNQQARTKRRAQVPAKMNRNSDPATAHGQLIGTSLTRAGCMRRVSCQKIFAWAACRLYGGWMGMYVMLQCLDSSVGNHGEPSPNCMCQKKTQTAGGS